jgi:L-ascorbate metabolism protein UlaG (beta-lactamase superfamily)
MSTDSIQLTFLGHAGMRVDGADLRMVMDCWLTERGAFQGSWHQFPSNAHLDQRQIPWRVRAAASGRRRPRCK